MGTTYKLTPMPKGKPTRWRKKDKRLPTGFIYFPVLEGETKEQSYRRCWGEWLKVQEELNRQAACPHRVTAQTQLAVDPPLEDHETLRLLGGVLLNPVIDAGETDLGTIDGDNPDDIREAALIRLSASGTPDVPSISRELDEQYKAKQQRAKTGQLATTTADRFREKVEHFVGWIGGSLPLTAITSRRILDYHNLLAEEMVKGKRTFGGAKDQQATVIHFVETAYYVSETLPDLPKIIGQRRTSLRFTSNGAEKKRRDTSNWHNDLKTLAKIAAACNPRTRLFLYLGLNCGYQQTDIAELGQDELVGNQIVERKRCKGDRKQHVPEVTYTLWPETLELLAIFRAGANAPHNRKGKPRVLVTENNTPLLIARPKADNIHRAYRRILDKIDLPRSQRKPIAALRKTSSTLLDHSIRLTNHQRNYTTISRLFLGQAPADVKGKHYTPGDMELLQEALEWLREVYRKHKVII
jgi:hypothetical protein